MMRNYILGIITGASFALIFNMLYFVLLQPSQPTPQKSNFKVVDTYKGCSVVQWSNWYSSTYKYFLDCEK